MRPSIDPRSCLAIVAVLVTGAAGCAPETTPVATVPIQEISADAYHAGPRLSFDVVATLCGPTAEPSNRPVVPCALSPQSSAAKGLNGETLVWEYGGVIRRYDANGTQRPNLGGVGEGDGEYKLAVAAGPSASGISVFDVARMMLIEFDSNGTFRGLRQIPVPQATRQVVVANGRLVMFTLQSQPTGGGSVFRALAASQSGAADTLASLVLPGNVSRSGRLQELPGLFEAQPVWGASPIGEVLFSDGARFEITGFHEGKVVRQLTVEYAPRAVEPEETARESALMRRRVAANLQEAVEGAIARVAKQHPSITQVLGLPDGGLLVREATRAAGDSVRWNRFDPDWQMRGYLLTADSDRVLLVDGQRLLLMQRADDDIALRWFALP